MSDSTSYINYSMKKINLVHSDLDSNGDMRWPNGVHQNQNILTTQNRSPSGNFYADSFKSNNWMNKCTFDTIPANEKYVFPIYVECNRFWNSIYSSTPLDIPARVIADINCDRARLIFFMIKEGQGFQMDERIQFIKNQMQLLNLNSKHIYYIDGNAKTNQVLSLHGIKGLTHNYWLDFNMAIDTTDIINDMVDRKYRAYKFLSFNRCARDFRAILISRLINADVDRGSILTCSDMYESTPFSFTQSIMEEMDIIKKSNIFPRIHDTLDYVYSNPIDVNLSTHIDSYINICTETFYSHQADRLFFSEKSFKPIICLQPFILVGQPKSLEYLKINGFKTFHPYINEDYDQEINDAARLDMIVKEVIRLNRLAIGELHTLLLNLLPVLQHNANWYKHQFTNNIQDETTINNIFDTWNDTI